MNEPEVDRGTGDAGTTLIEILMAVTLVGITFVALLAGLSTVAIGSDIHRKQADAEVVLTSAADRLKAPEVVHAPCAEVGSSNLDGYLAAARSATVPAGWDAVAAIRITDVQYWDGTAFGPTCHDTDALGHLLTLQEITLEVHSPDDRAVERITVVRGPAKVQTP